ncbi:biotin--[acetyl-CoA-carboxylase] ligase [Nicoliella lavandulae]|uniref:Bifunctional ligase/repressor BirA n=1 Tax=Nicoliella lavandulae TaxID=3082954 RepID=A0ABU8SKE3_9LACO
MPHHELLKIFLNHQNEWLSGNQLAEKLAVSRTMVWKRINALKAAGHQIEGKHNLGYRYLGSLNLNADNIKHLVHTPIDIECLSTVDSTNKYAKDLVNQRIIDHPIVVIANQQTAGYGRRGRQFYSPANSGLYMTIAVPVNHDHPLNPGLLTTTTAVAVVNALKQSYPTTDFKLKWINDIWVNGNKVAGIMTESIMNVELMQPSAIIVGIGINLQTAEFPASINQPVGSISSQQIDRNQIAADIINQFLAEYPHYQDGKRMDEYRKLSVVIGHEVTISTNHAPLVGIVETIDDNGALVLKTNDGKRHHVMTGEVTKVRLNHG